MQESEAGKQEIQLKKMYKQKGHQSIGKISWVNEQIAQIINV